MCLHISYFSYNSDGQPDADGKNYLQGGPVLTLKTCDRAQCDDLSYIVEEGARLGTL